MSEQGGQCGAQRGVPRTRRKDRFGLLTAILALAAAAAWAPVARGQAREGDPDISVRFGFDNAVLLGRWMPLTVVVEGGAEPFEGVLVVSYSQDGGQAASVERRIAATPGRRTPVHLVIRPDAKCDRLTVTLQSASGRYVRRHVYDQYPSARERQLPFSPMQSNLVVLGVAGRDQDLSSMRWLSDAAMNKSAVGLVQVSRPILAPAELPMSWLAYDGVLAVVVDGAAARHADPRSLAALREWVAAGGRLVIIADDPGGDGIGAAGGGGWRDWLPPGPQGDLVALSPVREVTIPDDLMAAIAEGPPDGIAVNMGLAPEPARSDSEEATEEEEKPGDAPDADAAGEAAPAEAPRRSGRTIQLTETGVNAGWRQRWIVDKGEPAERSSLLAEGPVGFGWAIVLGMDPRTATPRVSGEDMIAVWSDALREGLGDFLPIAAEFGGGAGAGLPAGASGFASTPRTSAVAHNSSMNAVADVPAAGGGAFVLVILGGLALVALIGPVDALALRRLRLRHRSWLTALGWIGLASLAAHGLPRLMRSGDTILARVECVDAIDMGEGAEPFNLAFGTSVTGIFSGRTQDAELLDGQRDAYWSGVSTLRDAWSQRSTPTFTVHSVQAGPALTTASPNDPWGGFLPGDGIEIEPSRMRLNLWTFRTFLDQARLAAPIRASVNNVAGDWEVSMRIPVSSVDARVEAWLQLRDGWRHVAMIHDDQGWKTGRAGPAVTDTPSVWQPTTETSNTYSYGYWGGFHEAFAPHHALKLPGPDRRELAIAALLESGRWGVVYLHAKGPDEAADAPARSPVSGVDLPGAIRRTTLVYRIVVPLPEHAWLK